MFSFSTSVSYSPLSTFSALFSPFVWERLAHHLPFVDGGALGFLDVSRPCQAGYRQDSSEGSRRHDHRGKGGIAHTCITVSVAQSKGIHILLPPRALEKAEDARQWSSLRLVDEYEGYIPTWPVSEAFEMFVSSHGDIAHPLTRFYTHALVHAHHTYFLSLRARLMHAARPEPIRV